MRRTHCRKIRELSPVTWQWAYWMLTYGIQCWWCVHRLWWRKDRAQQHVRGTDEDVGDRGSTQCQSHVVRRKRESEVPRLDERDVMKACEPIRSLCLI